MHQIGILAKPSHDLNRLVAGLRTSGRWRTLIYPQIHQVVEVLHPFRQSAQTLDLEALILFMDCFENHQAELALKFRKILGTRPLVIFSSHLPVPDVERAIHNTPTAWLETQRSLDQADSVLRKLLLGQSVGTRRHVRYKTFQAATLRTAAANKSHPAVVLDLAVGGAQVRSFGGAFALGDRLDLFIHLPALNKEHRVFAEVVWTAKETLISPGEVSSHRLGLRFL